MLWVVVARRLQRPDGVASGTGRFPFVSPLQLLRPSPPLAMPSRYRCTRAAGSRHSLLTCRPQVGPQHLDLGKCFPSDPARQKRENDHSPSEGEAA